MSIVFLMVAVDVPAETLFERDGVSLRGTAEVLEYGAATCRVLEGNHSAEEYERLKANEGKPLNLWRLEFSVHNGSGRDLDHLLAMYSIDSPWPPCTNWDGVSGVDWSSTSGTIQRTAKPFAVAAGETLTETRSILAFHSDAPRFERWSVNYTFAVGGAADAQADPSGLPSAVPQVSSAPVSVPSIAAADTCEGKPEGAACWKPLSDRPDCHVWDSNLVTRQTVTWSGQCKGRVADGEGILTWRLDDGVSTFEGRLQDGKQRGQWVQRFANGNVFEGPFVDGERHGQWVLRSADGDVQEGPYVDGKKHGQWVLRVADGGVHEGSYVDGKRHGQWVERFASGTVAEGPYVDGKEHGQWVLRSADGGVQEGPFVDGMKRGQWVERFANGNVREGPYVDGKRHGQWVERFASGTVQEGPYVDGKMHGQWVVRDSNGSITYICTWRTGDFDGCQSIGSAR